MDQRKILVLGRGLVGREIAEALSKEGHLVDNIGREPGAASSSFWDLSRPGQFRLQGPYDCGVVAAGMTSFKACEADEARSFSVNVVGRSAAVRELLGMGCHVTLLSSDAVFSGERPIDRVDQPPDAQSVYGKHLAHAEDLVAEMDGDVAVLRLGKVMHRDLPLLRDWTAKLSQGTNVRAFLDSVCAPVSLEYATQAVSHVLKSNIVGTVNVTDDVDTSWFEVACLVANTVGVPVAHVERELCVKSLGNEVCRRFSALPLTHRLPDGAPRGAAAVISAVRLIMQENFS